MSKSAVRMIAVLIIGAILVFLILNKIGVFGGDAPTAEAETAPASQASALPVRAFVLQTQSLTDELTVTGTLYPDESVELSSEVSGKITGIYFQEGAYVAKGKVLARVDDSELQAQLKMVKFRAQLASQQESRKKKLLEIGGISQEEYDEALTAFNTLETEAELIEVQIRKTSIIAPFSGKVGLRYISAGSYVIPGTRIARIVKLNPIKIEFAVPEKYGNKIPATTNISFQVAGQSTIYTGKVYAREPAINTDTRTLLMRAKSSNPSGTLIPGAFANVQIALGVEAASLMVPTEAILPDVEGQKVYVYRSGNAEALPVQTGIRQSKNIQITAGLSPGDTVITSGILQLRNGMVVSLTAVE